MRCISVWLLLFLALLLVGAWMFRYEPIETGRLAPEGARWMWDRWAQRVCLGVQNGMPRNNEVICGKF